MVDEHINSYNSPYKFNAKELDEETGNYYYGARYYNPKWSIWLSVDPMAEEFPGWSPYNYTLQNPINFIDPDGNIVTPAFKSKENRRLYDNIISNLSRSTYFSNVYNSLDRDYDNIVISEFTKSDTKNYGRAAAFTKTPLISTFFTSDITRIGLRNDNVGSGFNNWTIAEEFFHAAQDQFGGKSNFFAKEAEAKLFSAFLVYQNMDRSKRGDIKAIAQALKGSGATSIDRRLLIFGNKINIKITNYFDAILNGDFINEKMESNFRAAMDQYEGYLDYRNYGGNVLDSSTDGGETPIFDKVIKNVDLDD